MTVHANIPINKVVTWKSWTLSLSLFFKRTVSNIWESKVKCINSIENKKEKQILL